MNFKKLPIAKFLVPVGLVLALATIYEFRSEQDKQKSIDVKSIDNSVNPGVDFYEYANASWIKNNPIPSTESSWNSFSELSEKNRTILHKILDDAAANTSAAKGSNTQKLGDFYFTGMDSANIEKQGIAPLISEFKYIDKINNKKKLISAIEHFNSIGTSTPFGMYVEIDDKNSADQVLRLYQSGLSLPGKEYYFNQDARSQNIREKYNEYVTKMFTMMGDSKEKAEANAKTVMTIETALARNSMGRVEMRDPYATYHKMTFMEFEKTTPSINWDIYLEQTGISPKPKELIVSQPAFFTYFNKMVDSVSIADWKTYMRWHLINSTASDLSSNFDLEHFNFYGKVLSGVKKQQPRWKRILQATDGNLGEILGQEYVKVAFPPEAKAKALGMVKNLQAELRERITKLDWMSDETKSKAMDKLNKMMIKIGYPDKWKDYSKLEITRESYVMNEIRASQFSYHENMEKFGKPVDRTEWHMTPPTINAYYNPSLNEIVFPAGILQYPFFDANADDAVNYGGIGAVIGHEMTHGFDDEGRQYDAEGNLKDWWTPKDAENYESRTKIVVDQFNHYVALDTMHINGQLTLGENIADLGGITVAYYAYEKSLEGKSREMIDGFTPEQRFFIAFAQLWKGNYRPEALSRQLITNPHSPGKYRVLGPLSNMTEFQSAFHIQDGQPMVRPNDKKARIW
jgi:putative endopeptidase